jgi:hypothetical protein
MSVSFAISTKPIYRTFTVDESSAIYNVEIDENLVEIIFHSNTERAYVFRGSDRLIPYLTSVLKSPDLLGQSLGSLIAKWRKSGDLEYIEFPQD